MWLPYLLCVDWALQTAHSWVPLWVAGHRQPDLGQLLPEVSPLGVWEASLGRAVISLGQQLQTLCRVSLFKVNMFKSQLQAHRHGILRLFPCLGSWQGKYNGPMLPGAVSAWERCHQLKLTPVCPRGRQRAFQCAAVEQELFPLLPLCPWQSHCASV